MEKIYLTIGQMAELNHVTTQTLRLYDREGVLKPEFQDCSNGYRYYHINQCATLDMIQTMKLCGMTLRQIERQLKNSSLKELYEMLLQQEIQLNEKMKQLLDSRKSIQRLCRNISQLEALPSVGEVFLENMPERRIDTISTKVEYFSEGYTGYEKMLRELKNHMVCEELPLSYFLNAGTLIRKEDFTEEQYTAHTVFIFVDEEYPNVETVQTLPAGLVMAVCGKNPDRELEYARRLYEKMQEMGYEAVGDYLCEVIAQLPAVREEEKNEMVYKIQVPVKKRRTQNAD